MREQPVLLDFTTIVRVVEVGGLVRMRQMRRIIKVFVTFLPLM
jgi:hypothetical protein